MQYILTEEEYRELTPRKNITRLELMIKDLNDKVMELSDHPCGSNADYRSVTFYCDDCPIGAMGTNTCIKSQQYSK